MIINKATCYVLKLTSGLLHYIFLGPTFLSPDLIIINKATCYVVKLTSGLLHYIFSVRYFDMDAFRSFRLLDLRERNRAEDLVQITGAC